MGEPDRDGMKEGRLLVVKAAELLDEGKYRESIEASSLGSKLVLGAMLDSWDCDDSAQGCWGKLKMAGKEIPVAVTAHLRSSCRRIDRQRAFYDGISEDRTRDLIGEEDAMEMINYAREIVRFAQRHHRRPERLDDLS